MPVFSGGTSLSKGWELIRRFSEDIDFKVIAPVSGSAGRDRKVRSAYRQHVIDALSGAGFMPVGETLIGNESRFFAVSFDYSGMFSTASGLRPHIRVEMSFQSPVLLPANRPLRSLISDAQGDSPEVPAFPCVDPIETAADKLSALSWRAIARRRGAEDDDPTIIRHLHDLAALENLASKAPGFRELVLSAAAIDTGRRGGEFPESPDARFATMLEILSSDPLWATEYADFVRQVSFAAPDEVVGFEKALAACRRLVELVLNQPIIPA